MRFSVSLPARALLCVLAAIPATAGPYTFETIADTSGPFATLGQHTVINNLGLVGFTASTGPANLGIYTGAGGVWNTIAMTGPAFSMLTQDIALNDLGTVAFGGVSPGGVNGIYTGSGGPWTTVFQPPGPSLLSMPDINNAGTVLFSQQLPTGQEAILKWTGGAPAVIYDTSGPFQHFVGETLNNAGVVTFLGEWDPGAGPGGGWGIYTDGLLEVAHQSGPYDVFSGAPDINDAHQVAFQARLDSGVTGIFVNTGVPGAVPFTVADTSGPLFALSPFPSINSAGYVAYWADLDAGGRDLYIGNERVIGTGDTLNGQIITEVDVFSGGLNDYGQMAFWARFADGSEGVFRATPIPEPASWLMLGCYGLWWAARRRRRV